MTRQQQEDGEAYMAWRSNGNRTEEQIADAIRRGSEGRRSTGESERDARLRMVATGQGKGYIPQPERCTDR